VGVKRQEGLERPRLRFGGKRPALCDRSGGMRYRLDDQRRAGRSMGGASMGGYLEGRIPRCAARRARASRSPGLSPGEYAKATRRNQALQLGNGNGLTCGMHERHVLLKFVHAKSRRQVARRSISAWLQRVRGRKRASQRRISVEDILKGRDVDRR